MGWILGSIAAIVLEIICAVMDWICGLYGNFRLSIGWGTGNKNAFDNILPDAESFQALFVLTALVFMLGALIFKYFYGIIGPSSETESPLTMTVTAVVSGFLIFWSYDLFIFFERIANSLYIMFNNVFRDTAEKPDDLSNFFVRFIGESKIVKSSGGFFGGAIDDVVTTPSELIIDLVLIFMFAALLYQLVSFMAETFMRYVVLGVMFYTCPMAFSCIAFKSTRNIFWNWVRMLFSQFFLLMLNLFFMGVFNGALWNLCLEADKNGYLFSSEQNLVTTMFILIGWLVIAQKMDQYLASLGLSVAQTGAGLLPAIVSGAMMAKGMISSVRNGYRTAKGVSSFADNVSGNRTAFDSALSAGGREGSDIYKMHKDNGIIAGAEAGKQNGRYTQEGAASVIKDTEMETVKGSNAVDAADAIGIDVREIDGADLSKTEAGAGHVAVKDAEGQTLREYGLADRYEAPDGGATKQVKTGAGIMSYAATSDIVNEDVQNIMNDLKQSDANKDIDFRNNGDGSITGFDKDGNPCIYSAPYYMATPDMSKGPFTVSQTGDTPYFTQDIRGACMSEVGKINDQSDQAISSLSGNPEYSGITWSNKGDGTFIGRDAEGNARYQGAVGDMAEFDSGKGNIRSISEAGGLSYSIQDIGGSVSAAETQFNENNSRIFEALQNDGTYAENGISWKDNGNGTFTGMNREGIPVMQAANPDAADFVKNKGCITEGAVDTGSGNIPYSVQALDPGKKEGFKQIHSAKDVAAATGGGFTSQKDIREEAGRKAATPGTIKPVAKTPDLVRKDVAQTAGTGQTQAKPYHAPNFHAGTQGGSTFARRAAEYGRAESAVKPESHSATEPGALRSASQPHGPVHTPSPAAPQAPHTSQTPVQGPEAIHGGNMKQGGTHSGSMKDKVSGRYDAMYEEEKEISVTEKVSKGLKNLFGKNSK